MLVWLMDEASAFLSKLKRENAEDIHQTLKTSAASRFGKRYVGLIISWPRHADDFTMTKHKEAKLDPTLGVYADGPASTWEVNELTKLEPRVEIRPGLIVPASLANDFISDPEGALGRYCCQPPMAREAFIRYPDRLWSAVDRVRPVRDDRPPRRIDQPAPGFQGGAAAYCSAAARSPHRSQRGRPPVPGTRCSPLISP